MIALLLLAAPPDLGALRAQSVAAAGAAERAHAAAHEALVKRDAAEKDLAKRKAELASGNGGWFGERRVRNLSATVRELSEDSFAAERRAAEADALLASAREALRDALFSRAGEQAGAGDAAARAGHSDEAQLAYREAAARLAEAATIPAETDDADPWRGLDAEIPLAGDETPSERAAVASAYLHAADLVAERLVKFRKRSRALEPAVAAWARLSRFRGVLERAGAASDPTPQQNRLLEIIAPGSALEAKLRLRGAGAAPK